MSRRRFVYREVEPGKVESFEVTDDWRPTNADTGHKSEEEVFGKLQHSDGTDLSTRKRHREFMKSRGLTLSDDYKDHWAKAEQRRADLFSGKGSDKGVRQSLEKAVYQLTEGKKRGK